MRKYILYLTAAVLTSGLIWISPMAVLAAPETTQQETAAEDQDADASELVQTADAVAEDEIIEETVEEYIPEEDETEEDEAEDAADGSAASASETAAQVDPARVELVNYALQFVGGRYRAGGNDPHTGADCSGFVKYVMQNGAGITMNRTSAAQSTQGQAISADQMQPGDLLFYSNGSRVNHVAMYIGNGQIVHASTYKTGIKISQWNYRNPVRIVNMIG